MCPKQPKSHKPVQGTFAVWVQNSGYEASLEGDKIYVVLMDRNATRTHAERDGDLHGVDESGEDYHFSGDRFISVDAAAAVKTSLLKA